ncbi:hypothetical protein [Kineococcus terrestris]|uniref:hypothetical protein n=1 Tax=Kineococcus terrestris TaxID=2044856 RepID=UPI0034DACFA3
MTPPARRAAAVAAAAALLLAAPGTAAAAPASPAPAAAGATPLAGPPAGRPFPATVPLPTGSLPEGIAEGPGTTFYAGSRADGSVVRGNLRTGVTTPFVPGVEGRVAVGMRYEEGADRLWVAGGATGAVTAYDGTTGEELGRWLVPGSGFLNDVEVTRDAVLVTDSAVQRLVVVPLGPGGELPGPDGARTLPITGDLVYGEGFNANGIRALPTGQLLVTQSSTGDLFRVDPATGASVRVPVGGRDLTSGDGLVLRGPFLYVVNGFSGDSAAVVLLTPGGRAGLVVGEVSSPLLDRPTTGILAAGALYLVNGRFEVEDPESAEYQVVRVELR